MSKTHMLDDRTVGVLLERAMGLVHHQQNHARRVKNAFRQVVRHRLRRAVEDAPLPPQFPASFDRDVAVQLGRVFFWQTDHIVARLDLLGY